MKSERPVSVISIIILVLAAMTFSGCSTIFTPPPHPRPYWQAAEGATTQNIPKIAVIVIDQSQRLYGQNEAIPREVEDKFIEQLLGKGYRVADRSDVAQVINEIRFQHEGLTESDAARLGKMLNVPAVLVVTIEGINVALESTAINGLTIYSVRTSVSARLIGVESAEVLGLTSFTDTYEENDQNNLSSVVLVAEAVAEVVPSRTN